MKVLTSWSSVRIKSDNSKKKNPSSACRKGSVPSVLGTHLQQGLASFPVTPPTSPNRSDFHLVSTPSRLRPVQQSHVHSARGRHRCCADWSLHTYGERFLKKNTPSSAYMIRHRASEEVPASECLDAHTSWIPGRCSSANPALMPGAWCAREQRLSPLTSEALFPCLKNEANSISCSSHNQPRKEIAVSHHLPSAVKSCLSDRQNEHDPFCYLNPHSCLLSVTVSHLDICKSSNCWPSLWPPTVHTPHSIQSQTFKGQIRSYLSLL